MSLSQVILLLALVTSNVAQPFTDGGFVVLPNSWEGMSGSGSGSGSGALSVEESGSGSGSGGPWEESGSGSGSGEVWEEESGSGSGSEFGEESGSSSGSGSGEVWKEESGSGSGSGEVWEEESGSGSGSGEVWEEESGSGSGSGELWEEGSSFSGSGSGEVIPCEAIMCPPGSRCQPGSVVCPTNSTCFTLPSTCVPTDPCAIPFGISYTIGGGFSGSGEEGSGGSGYCPPNMENTNCGRICLEDCTVDLTYICANTPRCLCKTGQALYIRRDETAECVQPESCPCQ